MKYFLEPTVIGLNYLKSRSAADAFPSYHAYPKTIGMDYADAMRGYEGRVREALKEIGDASFRLEIDETAPSHMISRHTIEDVLLPELRMAAK